MTPDNTMRANRTGTAVAPDRASEMMAAVEEFPPTSDGAAKAIAAVRVAYAQEGADPARPALAKQTPLLMDKLGERLAFERVGTRLYEALLSKHEAYGSYDGGPSSDDITQILEEELQHFRMLAEIITELGGDPTEVTPSANLQLTASRGVRDVLVDPRTNLVESLEAIVMAELTDNECWETLAGLARLAGQEDLAERCEEALATEQEHLEKVRGWLAAGQGRPEVEGEGVAEESERNGGTGSPKKKSSHRK